MPPDVCACGSGGAQVALITGACHTRPPMQVTLTDVDIINGQNDNGGAMYITDTPVTVTRGAFINNLAVSVSRRNTHKHTVDGPRVSQHAPTHCRRHPPTHTSHSYATHKHIYAGTRTHMLSKTMF